MFKGHTKLVSLCGGNGVPVHMVYGVPSGTTSLEKEIVRIKRLVERNWNGVRNLSILRRSWWIMKKCSVKAAPYVAGGVVGAVIMEVIG